MAMTMAKSKKVSDLKVSRVELSLISLESTVLKLDA